MKKFYIELTAGLFMLVGVACLAYLSVHLGGLQLGGPNTYEVSATFSDIGGLRKGAEVVIAGVGIGRVKMVRFDKDKYAGEVTMAISENVKLPKGSIASIKTRGLIGEQYVAISPGGEPEDIEPGGRILHTQAAIDLFGLATKYGFGDVGRDEEGGKKKESQNDEDKL